MAELADPGPELRQAVEHICTRDADFSRVEAEAGPLQVRQWPATYSALVRTITGQQLSAQAAQAIFSRLQQQMGTVTPEQLLACSDADLKQAGLSRSKISTCQDLAERVLSGELPLAELGSWNDEAIATALTQIKGVGPWTADIFMLFSLNRLDALPASDLAVRVAYQQLKGLSERPSAKELRHHCAPLQPYRGVVAHLMWHYYRHRMGRSGQP
ncbi:MAG: DNA-3-methyladenine glycosylase 2 family protein [Cyanobacteria bacterium P01_A01_bin.135]